MKADFKLKDGSEYSLPVVKMTNGITINFFDPYSMDIVRNVMSTILKRVAELKEEGFETIVVPATKPIPMAWYLAYTLGMNLVVIKKEVKPYFPEIISFGCKSITSDRGNMMFITPDDMENLRGKNVLFFDDVVSTGATYEASKDFILDICQCKSFKALFVLKEGNTCKLDEDAEYLGFIPFE